MTASQESRIEGTDFSRIQALTPDLPLLIADASPTITVIGDVILDGWVYGTSERLAREAPAPVIDQSREVFAPGGAANTAMNLAALGARVRVAGLIGDDAEGKILATLLEEAGVDTSLLLTHPKVRTTAKTRVVVADQIMYRLDKATREHSPELLEQLADHALAAIPGSDAIIVCDYGAAIHMSPLPRLLAAYEDRPFTVVDSHDPAQWSVIGADMSTPNFAEVERALGRRLGTGQERVRAVAESAAELREVLGVDHPCVTLDRDGAVLLDSDGVAHRTWAKPATEKQASGAGDTFAAALTLARTVGLPLSTTADFAQAAADVVVHRLGTSRCSTRDLIAHLGGFSDSLLTLDELLERVASHREGGHRIVMTNGCFDVLHRGHTFSLNKAKQLGDILVVALNDDDSVRRLKGPERPINTLHDRAGVLGALSCVDYVTSFSTDTPIPIIEVLQPDIYVKGGDYTPETLKEAAAVEAYGGQVRILDYVPDYSTTSVVERMRGSAPTPA